MAAGSWRAGWLADCLVWAWMYGGPLAQLRTKTRKTDTPVFREKSASEQRTKVWSFRPDS